MAVAAMARVAVFGHRFDQDAVLEELQGSGMLEITPSTLNGSEVLNNGENAELEAELNGLRSTIEFLDRIEGRKKSFLGSLFPVLPVGELKDLVRAHRHFDWRSVIKELGDLESEIANLRNLQAKLTNETALLSPWQKLNIPLDRLACTTKSCVLIGRHKVKAAESFMDEVRKLDPLIDIREVDRTALESHLVIFCHLSKEKMLNDRLSRSEFIKVNLPVSPLTPAAEIGKLKSLYQEADEKQGEFLRQAKLLIAHRPELMKVYDHLNLYRSKRLALEKAHHTRSAFILMGWVREKDLSRLRGRLVQTHPTVELLKIEPEKGETTPTYIENDPVFKPFEVITKIFGLPRQAEIDPTAPLSFFYLFFFAVCLSDAGYGIILAALAWLMLKKLQLTEGARDLLTLLLWGGLLTIAVGILTGSYFSIELDKLPAGSIKDAALGLRLIDPIKNPLNVLMLSLLIGVIQNLTGLFIGMYWKFKNREYLIGLLDFGLWIFFLVSLVGFAITAYLKLPLADIFTKASILGAAALVLTQGRNEPSLLKKAITGVLSLYRTTGFLGDTLSYSRLLALMMTTSIIGMVVNIIAGLLQGIPWIGWVLMAVMLVFGHLFNLVVSALGAFIHAMRLQLVEFFGKFYEGGGRAFKPFRRETRYVLIR